MRLIPLLVFATFTAGAYPLDGFQETGIRRLEAGRLAVEGVIDITPPPPGARLPTHAVDLRLTRRPTFTRPAEDVLLEGQIRNLLGDDVDRYGIAVLDLSDPNAPRFAEINGDYRQNVGSVGKIIAALGLFQALADAWPDESDRIQVLRTRIVTADEFAHYDHHSVSFYDPKTEALEKRPIEDGDQANLWEYLDWMLSPSSNSAAGMVMREAMLLREYGRAYPPSDEEVRAFFDETSREELADLYRATFDEALLRQGFDLGQIRQGSFFTRVGKKKVPGSGTSYATANSLLRLALLMEQGLLVDEFTSRQLKRLLYMTERRIRFASSQELSDAAVYFKSGSLYGCEPEEGFTCGSYRGNRMNYMNSFAIVESDTGGRRLHYMVMLISNVLRKNSAADHQALGGRIQQLMQEAHSVDDAWEVDDRAGRIANPEP